MNRFFRKQSQEPTSVEEQRSYQRIRVVLNVLCRQHGDDVPIFTDDVSEAGLRFISQQALETDADVLLTMPIQPGHPAVQLKGRVVWLREQGENHFMGGISFLDLDDEGRAAWTAFIARNR